MSSVLTRKYSEVRSWIHMEVGSLHICEIKEMPDQKKDDKEQGNEKQEEKEGKRE